MYLQCIVTKSSKMLVPIVTYIISKITAKTIAEVDLPLY